MLCTHTQSENKPTYHCWSNDNHLIWMVVKMVNILCFDFVILFVGISAFLFVYKQNKQKGGSFRVNGCWSGLAQLILLGSALISLDKMQMGSAGILGSADLPGSDQLTPFDKRTAMMGLKLNHVSKRDPLSMCSKANITLKWMSEDLVDY